MTSRSTSPLLLTLGLAVTLLLAGCQQPGEEDPGGAVTPVPVPTITTPATSPAPTPTADPSPTATATEDDPEGTVTLAYFLIRESGERVWVEPVRFTADRSEVDGAVARTAVGELLTATPPPGLSQPVPVGTELLDIDVDGTILRVDLSEEIRTNPGLGAAGEEAFAQALAHTGAQFDTVDAVVLLVEGEEIDELWGHVDWSAPIEPDLFALSPIVVEQAVTAAGTIDLAGSANVFEATFDIELRDDEGAVVEEDFVTATSGTGTRGTWTHTFSGLDAGSYTIVVREPDPSDGEGFPPFEAELLVEVPE